MVIILGSCVNICFLYFNRLYGQVYDMGPQIIKILKKWIILNILKNSFIFYTILICLSIYSILINNL